MIQVEIDENSGFCFGVTTAIKKAEEELAKGEQLYCLGDIVHNGIECARLEKMGLITIDHNRFCKLHHARVLLRAHGEPPETYKTAKLNNIEIIDATCPVVLQLQRRIKQKGEENCDEESQIVIYGQKNHAEVLGLMGQAKGKVSVIENIEDIEKLDFSRSISLFSQTTKSNVDYLEIINAIKERISQQATFYYSNSVCKQVSSRLHDISDFAAAHDLVFFVCGKKSSNGKILFAECKKVNSNTHLIDNEKEIDFRLLHGIHSVGICGATSTPKWLMERCKQAILEHTA